MKNRIICFMTGLVIGSGIIITFNSLDRVAAFEVRQSAETLVMGAME
jgi:hypothetical protein